MKWNIDSLSQLYATVKTVQKNVKLLHLMRKVCKETDDPKVTFRVTIFTDTKEQEFVANAERVGATIQKIENAQTNLYEATVQHSKWRELFGKMDMFDFLIKEHKIRVEVSDQKKYTISVNPIVYIFCRDALD